MISCGVPFPVGGAPRIVPPFTVVIAYYATEEPMVYWPVNPGNGVAKGSGSPQTGGGTYTGLQTPFGKIIVVEGYSGTPQNVGLYIPIADMPGGIDVGAGAIVGMYLNDQYYPISFSGTNTLYGNCRYWYTDVSPVLPNDQFLNQSAPFKLEIRYRAT